MDCVLIQAGAAHEIWRGTSKAQLTEKFAPAILDAVVETALPVDIKFTWNGTAFTGQRWLIVTASGEFVPGSGGYVDPVPVAGQSVVMTGSRTPQPRTEKWGGSAIVAKSAAEIASFDAAANTAKFTATSRRKDNLADAAARVRSRNITVWDNMTIQQKKDATLAEADVWVNIRAFIEDNL